MTDKVGVDGSGCTRRSYCKLSEGSGRGNGVNGKRMVRKRVVGEREGTQLYVLIIFSEDF